MNIPIDDADGCQRSSPDRNTLLQDGAHHLPDRGAQEQTLSGLRAQKGHMTNGILRLMVWNHEFVAREGRVQHLYFCKLSTRRVRLLACSNTSGMGSRART